jgi:PAB1-binding protein PBP1
MTSWKVPLGAYYPFLDQRIFGAPWIPTSAESVGSGAVAFQTPEHRAQAFITITPGEPDRALLMSSWPLHLVFQILERLSIKG